MKRFMVMFLAIICSLNSWCQTTIPVFTVAHELFKTHVTSASDIVSVLKKHGLATDKTWRPLEKNMLYQERLLGYTQIKEYEVMTQVVYSNKIKMVVVQIMDGRKYYPTLLSYLRKNNYEISDYGGTDLTTYTNVNKGLVCGVTLYSTGPSAGWLEVGFCPLDVSK